jgi:hypothetical protein
MSLKDLIMKKLKKNFFYFEELDSSSEDFENEYYSFPEFKNTGKISLHSDPGQMSKIKEISLHSDPGQMNKRDQ